MGDPMDGQRWIYFTDEEVKGLQPEFVALLDRARHDAGVPFTITCGFRDPEHNAQVGGVSDSAHLKGLAVDLHCPDSHTAFLIVQACLAVGIKRAGVYHGQPDAEGHVQSTHIHVDFDPDLPQEVLWTGFSH